MRQRNYSFRLAYSEGDECYLATIPEFRNVAGHGDTPQEALQEAEVSLQAALEVYEAKGWPLPEPEQQGEYSGQFRLRVPKSLHAKLAAQAALDGVSLNAYIISLLAQNSEGSKIFSELKKELRSLSGGNELNRNTANLLAATTQLISVISKPSEHGEMEPEPKNVVNFAPYITIASNNELKEK